MKIGLGTSYITEYSEYVPHDNCHKRCDICFLWHEGYRVHIFLFLGMRFLKWESVGIKKE